jgi:hypothetical protein
MRNASIGKLRLRPLRKCSGAWKRVKTGDWNPSCANQTSGMRRITVANLQFDFRTPFPALSRPLGVQYSMLDVGCFCILHSSFFISSRLRQERISRPLAQFADNLRLRVFAPLLFIRFSAFQPNPNVLSGDPARCYALATR